jgi:hypothetical protein
VAIKGMVDEFQTVSKSNQNIQSIADMQRFVENYPEFRAKSGNVSKHVTLMGEMSRAIDERRLMQVSQIEQARFPLRRKTAREAGADLGIHRRRTSHAALRTAWWRSLPCPSFSRIRRCGATRPLIHGAVC